jgi:chromosome segregation ATPase
MAPIVLWPIVTAIGTLFGIGGTVYGVDQHQKRQKESAAFRAHLRKIEVELADKEQQLASLRALLRKKNEQVKELADIVKDLEAEVDQLRNAANDMRSSL